MWGVDWIDLAENRGMCWAIVKTSQFLIEYFFYVMGGVQNF
jgi:hypothetical protein